MIENELTNNVEELEEKHEFMIQDEYGREMMYAVVGNMYPIFHNGIAAALFFKEFKKFAVKGYEFCAGNHDFSFLLQF